MKIGGKFILTTTLLLTGTITILSYGILASVSAIQKEDLKKQARVVENSAQRVALDALLQKDELQLVSYINFLKAQYPALCYAKIAWNYPPMSQKIELGKLSKSSDIEERRFDIESPGNPNHNVIMQFYVDRSVLKKAMAKAKEKLAQVILRIWGLSIILGALLAWISAWVLTFPLKSLARIASQVGSGRLGVKLEWNSRDEIGALVYSFNQMSEKLKELDTMKKNFVSSVTHELRSPLGAMISLAALVKDKLSAEGTPTSKQSLDYLDRIEKNAKRLDQFISQLLDAAKIEQGKFTCSPRPADISPIIADIVNLFGPKAKEHGIQLSNEIPEKSFAMADPDRIRQVFSNLISNALKFTPANGEIKIKAEKFREGDERFFEVSVQDNGKGMSEEDLKKLFQAFSQGNNAGAQGLSGAERGTGLGLYIVKSIVEAHGGKISVRSSPGQGSVFTFTLKEAKNAVETQK